VTRIGEPINAHPVLGASVRRSFQLLTQKERSPTCWFRSSLNANLYPASPVSSRPRCWLQNTLACGSSLVFDLADRWARRPHPRQPGQPRAPKFRHQGGNTYPSVPSSVLSICSVAMSTPSRALTFNGCSAMFLRYIAKACSLFPAGRRSNTLKGGPYTLLKTVTPQVLQCAVPLYPLPLRYSKVFSLPWILTCSFVG
jgi:hypothetical protein